MPLRIGNNTGNSGGVQDVCLDTYSPTANYGALNVIRAGIFSSRTITSLLRFNLSSVSPSVTIGSAILYLYDDNWANRSADCTLTLYKVSDANGDWIPGTDTGASQVGSPCWYKKAYNTVDWAGSAGCLTPTTDYINTALGSEVFTDEVSGYRAITLNADGLAAIQSWLGGSGGNGILIVGTGSSGCWTEIVSSDGADGQRPYLALTYGSIQTESLALSDVPDATLIRFAVVTETMSLTDSSDFVDAGTFGTLNLRTPVPVLRFIGGGSLSYNLSKAAFSFTGGDGTMDPLHIVSPVSMLKFVSGGHLSIALPLPNLSFSGDDNSSGTLQITRPSNVVIFAGGDGTTGPLALVLPQAIMSFTGGDESSGVLNITLPVAIFTLKGSTSDPTAIVDPTDTTSLAYLQRAVVMNQTNMAISEYTNYRFNSIAQIAGEVFLASDQGLFLRGGDTDNGSDIVAVARTVLDDYESKKNIPILYLSLRASQNVMVATVEDGGELSSEQEVDCGNEHIKIRRVLLAKGKKQRYWGVEIRNTNGGSLDLDVIDLNVVQLIRRV